MRGGSRPGRRLRQWTDAELLRILDLDAAGLTRERIAREMGATRNQIIGLLHRMREDQSGAHHDGTMSPEWVRAGLKGRLRAIWGDGGPDCGGPILSEPSP